MILTIDTEKESSASLKRIARFLETLAGQDFSADSSSRPDDSVVEGAADLFGMFGGDDDDSSSSAPPVTKPSSYSVQPY